MGVMTQQMVNEERERALIGLLDDPSPVVREALSGEFARLGSAGVTLLQKAVEETTGDARDHASFLLESLAPADPVQMMVHFIRGLQYDLETGFFLINKVIQPDLRVDAVRRQLDEMAARCREIIVSPSTERKSCKVINRVLFHEYGFRGDREDYENPLNSCMDAVLQRRRGLPITLSVMYILVAQRIGLDLEPIGLPGHFMVGCFHGEAPFYIDPFDGGRFHDLGGIRELLEAQDIAPELYHVVPMPVGEVLCRACRNLVAHFNDRGQPAWANRFRVFVKEFEQTHQRESQA